MVAMVRVLPAALLLCSLFCAGAALLCYVCDSSVEPSCAGVSRSLYLRFRHLGKCRSFSDERGRPIGRPLCYSTGPPGSAKRGCLSENPRACLEEPCHVCDTNFCNGSSSSQRHGSSLFLVALHVVVGLANLRTLAAC